METERKKSLSIEKTSHKRIKDNNGKIKVQKRRANKLTETHMDVRVKLTTPLLLPMMI
jgi:hypothetical protein